MNSVGSVNRKDINSSSELIVIYNKVQREILFHNLPLDSFFESINMQTEPFFVNSFEDNLTKEWQSCLLLKEKETYNFSRQAILADNTPVVFDFHVAGISLASTDNKSLLLFFIRRTFGLISTRDYGKDYAEFIDLAAHDLDAPLRKISLLLERLSYKSKAGTVSDIDDFIGRIQTNLSDMRFLLDSLTILAKVNSATPEKICCNTEDIVSEISDRWEERFKKRKVMLSVSSLPELVGDRNQFKQLFSNLLDNSIKFSKESGGAITVGSSSLTAEEKRRYPLKYETAYGKITVTDNGIGFRDEYAEKIFEPFVRLNARSQYPGGGMGLAICRKIVENNNGIIYAKGEEDKGANFTIILPQRFD